MEKPKILTNAEVWERENKRRGGNLPATHIVSTKESKEAQLDADILFYEPLIEKLEKEKYDLAFEVRKQAKSEVAREMIQWLYDHSIVQVGSLERMIPLENWIAFQSKYGGQKK